MQNEKSDEVERLGVQVPPSTDLPPTPEEVAHVTKLAKTVGVMKRLREIVNHIQWE